MPHRHVLLDALCVHVSTLVSLEEGGVNIYLDTHRIMFQSMDTNGCVKLNFMLMDHFLIIKLNWWYNVTNKNMASIISIHLVILLRCLQLE